MKVGQIGALLGIVASPFLTGCPGSLANPNDYLVPDSCGLQVLNDTCAKTNCHLTDSQATAAANLQLDYASIGDGSQLVGKMAEGPFCAPDAGTGTMTAIIDSAQPEMSLLYNKLDDNPVCGPRMPFLVPKALTADQKQCILDWIKTVPGVHGGTSTGDGG
jgi:hypothetical protein